jgi:CRP-like cAMP-binding protein
MTTGMTHSLVPLLFFIVMVMVASGLLYDGVIREFASSVFTSYNWFFLIFTNDNFDRILPQDVVMNMSYLIFFFPCIYVGQRFLLSLIIGDTYETYKAFVKKQLKKEKLKEMQGLVKAFSALDVQKCGAISALQWKEGCNKYDPNVSDEAVALYFELLSGGNSCISVLQFLNMRNVLNFNLRLRSNTKSFFSNLYMPVCDAVRSAYTKIQLPVTPDCTALCKRLLELESRWEVLIKLNALDLIALCFSLSDYALGPLPIPLVGGLSLTVGLALNTFYLIEFAIRLCACAGRLHMVHDKNNTASHLFVLGVIGRVIVAATCFLYGLSPSSSIALPYYPAAWGAAPTFSVHKVTLLLRALRCIRVTNLNRDLRNFSMALLDVVPALSETFTFSFIVTYIFGALGNLLFGQYMAEWGTPLRAVVKAQQLAFMVNFLGSTEDAMEQVHPAAAIYFVSYLILTLAVSNIALSIIIELQNSMLAGKTSKDRDSQKAKLELMFNKIKDQARIRAVFHCRRGSPPMKFNNIVMSQFQSSDTRHFIADMDGEKELKLEDIKACQKYSSIDLVAHYSVEHRNHNDQHWEVEFLTAVGDSGVKLKHTFGPGDVVFEAGTDATKLFLVISGSIVFTEPNTLGQTFATAAFFIGQEALSPCNKYKYQCVAETETVVLAFTQQDIMERLDADICGTILRMSLKSHARLEAALLEARKRASRVSSTLYNYVDDEEESVVEEEEEEPKRSLSYSRSDRSIKVGRGLEREDSFKLGTAGFSLYRSSSSLGSSPSKPLVTRGLSPQSPLAEGDTPHSSADTPLESLIKEPASAFSASSDC